MDEPIKHIRNYTDRKPSFQEWVVERHGQSCSEIWDNFRKTGSNREYQKAMKWLRQQYREDMKRRELLMAANPFQNKEEK